MKRKYFYLWVFSTLTLALTSMTSCKDEYAGDNNELLAEIEANKRAINQIYSLLGDGSYINSVTKTANGIAINITTSAGIQVTYEITNGTNGINGTNGADGTPGTVWTIDAQGYWVKDGMPTSYKAIGNDGTNGTDGKDGADGKDGDDGKDGADGKDGNYYVPNYETGNFDIYDGTTNQKIGDSGISFMVQNQLAAVVDQKGNIVFTNVKIGEDYETYSVAMSNVLRGFVFERDEMGRVYIDGIPGIRILKYDYKPLTINSKDSKSENLSEGTAIQRDPSTYAYYHVNPANADFNLIKDHLQFVVKADAEYVKTRSTSSNLRLAAEAVELKEGVLKVKVIASGIPATGDNISVAALQSVAVKDTITSDYVTVCNTDVDLRIAIKGSTDKDLRTQINAADPLAYTPVKTLRAWEDYAAAGNVDITLPYDGQLDLNQVFVVHDTKNKHFEYTPENLEMKWKFEIVRNYQVGETTTVLQTNNAVITVQPTDQADFVSLSEDGILTAKVYDDNRKDAAIGRKPLLRISLMDGTRAVQIAYARVEIGGHQSAPTATRKEGIVVKAIDPTNPAGRYKLAYECGKFKYAVTTPEIINEELYNAVGMSHEEFHRLYPTFDALNTAPGTVGKVYEVQENRTQYNHASTQLLQWEVSNKEIFDHAGKTISHRVRYLKDATTYVEVILQAEVEDIKKVFNVGIEDFINEYWENNFANANFNVAVPLSTSDVDPSHCVFINDLNSPFIVKSDGILRLRDDRQGVVDYIDYIFNKAAMERITQIPHDKEELGAVPVRFEVSADGLTLRATVDGVKEVIATIDNNHSLTPYNRVTYSKTSDVAKKLLNTNNMYALFSVKGYICNDPERPVTITFNGQEYFKARFARPVQLAPTSVRGFVDAVDYGQPGSYIQLEDVIAPTDWRGRPFSSHNNYWYFYGRTASPAFDVRVVNPQDSECDLNGVRQVLPPTIILDTQPSGWNGITTPWNFGCITYKNNGTTVLSRFNIFVQVKVEYGWGTIHELVTIPVEPYHE